MALYAFDGTWNSDKPGAQHDTNVLWFRRAYTGSVSTAKGRHAVRAVRPGAGDHGRGWTHPVTEGLHQLELNVAAGDSDIDIVGFSRGAALAIDFANRVSHLGWQSDDPVPGALGLRPVVRRREHRFRPHVGAGPAGQRGQVLPRAGARGAAAHVPPAPAQRAGRRRRRGRPPLRGVVPRRALRRGGRQQQPAAVEHRAELDVQKAVSCGLPIDPAKITENQARMKAGTPDSKGQWYDLD